MGSRAGGKRPIRLGDQPRCGNFDSTQVEKIASKDIRLEELHVTQDENGARGFAAPVVDLERLRFEEVTAIEEDHIVSLGLL